MRYGEVGGFAIDVDIAKVLFKDKEAYISAREEIYGTTLQIAKEKGLDIAIIVAQENNLNKQEEWLKNQDHEHRVLKGNAKHYRSVMHGDKPLLVNLTGKVNLRDMMRPITQRAR